MRWPEAAIAVVLQARQTTDNSTAAATEPVDLYPYSSLQQVGFFLLFFFPSLALLIVILRIWSRLANKQFGWDDALIMSAMMLSIAETGASFMGMRTAYLGVHVYDIPPTADLSLGMKWNYILQLLYNPILALVKSSVLLFLLRLGGQKPGVRWTIHSLNFFNIGLMIAIFVTVIFQCQPIDFFWDKTIKGGTCINTGAFYVATAGLTILTDVLVLVLPFWIFIGLKMPSKVKIALMVVFMLGGVVTVISILRLVWLVEISFGDPGKDPTYDIRFTYSAAETNLAIMCASAPALRGLIIKWFPRFFSSLGYGSNKYKSGSKYGNKSGSKYGNKSGNRYATGGTSGKNSGVRSFHRPTGNGTYQLEELKRTRPDNNSSTNTSEEEIMTYDGIVRTTEVNVVYDNKPSGSGSSSVREMELSGGLGTRFDYPEEPPHTHTAPRS